MPVLPYTTFIRIGSTTALSSFTLLALAGSSTPDLQTATSVKVPGTSGWIVMLALVWAPAPMVPRFVKVRTLPFRYQVSGEADTTVTCGGKTFVRITFGAVAGPRLWMVNV